MINKELLALALIKEGHLGSCPVVNGITAACVPGSGCKAISTITTYLNMTTDPPPDAQVVERITKMMHAARLIRSCMTCDHLDEPTEMCKLYQMRPPARVIAYGCQSWTDGLPF